jgi:hypothetical protein
MALQDKLFAKVMTLKLTVTIVVAMEVLVEFVRHIFF